VKKLISSILLFFSSSGLLQKALEANSGFLELVSNQDEKDGEGIKILTEISQNLEKLSQSPCYDLL